MKTPLTLILSASLIAGCATTPASRERAYHRASLIANSDHRYDVEKTNRAFDAVVNKGKPSLIQCYIVEHKYGWNGNGCADRVEVRKRETRLLIFGMIMLAAGIAACPDSVDDADACIFGG